MAGKFGSQAPRQRAASPGGKAGLPASRSSSSGADIIAPRIHDSKALYSRSLNASRAARRDSGERRTEAKGEEPNQRNTKMKRERVPQGARGRERRGRKHPSPRETRGFCSPRELAPRSRDRTYLTHPAPHPSTLPRATTDHAPHATQQRPRDGAAAGEPAKRTPVPHLPRAACPWSTGRTRSPRRPGSAAAATSRRTAPCTRCRRAAPRLGRDERRGGARVEAGKVFPGVGFSTRAHGQRFTTGPVVATAPTRFRA